MENRQENCGGCAYRKKWFCPIMGDYVARDGHCPEYEPMTDKKEGEKNG